ncbi:COQ9-domain-containing protein [Umbelopsis sp. AD052]|nr:COQ9-domain-containing protein [Umbelopsis sp. AD052]
MPRRLYTSDSSGAGIPKSTKPSLHPGQVRGALSQKKLMEATLPFVATHGWTTESISLGAQTLGYPSIAHGIFPNGPADLIELFLEDSRLKLESEMERKKAAGELENLRATDIVRLAVITRLEMTRPYIKRWPEALSVMAHPTNSVMSFTQLGKLVDDIWFYAGDKSPDMNWYTKRASLAAVYTSTELYMTQDVSPNSVDTLGFLQRRLEQAEFVGSGMKQLGTMLDFGARSFVGMVASRGNKI